MIEGNCDGAVDRMPDGLGIDPVLKAEARQDRRSLGVQLKLSAGLVGVEEDFGESPVGETAGGRAVPVRLKFKREGDRAAPVRKMLANGPHGIMPSARAAALAR